MTLDSALAEIVDNYHRAHGAERSPQETIRELLYIALTGDLEEAVISVARARGFNVVKSYVVQQIMLAFGEIERNLGEANNETLSRLGAVLNGELPAEEAQAVMQRMQLRSSGIVPGSNLDPSMVPAPRPDPLRRLQPGEPGYEIQSLLD